MDPRLQYLSDVLTQFFDARQAWVESDYRYITEDLERAADELADAFADGTIPGELRKVEQVVSREFSPAWLRFKDQAAATGDVHLLPDDAFWLAVAHLEKARQEAQPQTPVSIEPIPLLIEQKVSERQICLMYDWVDGRGNPEIWRLREEIAEPGKHTANWVPAAERRRQAQEWRQNELRRQVAERQMKKVERLTKPCQETTEELIEQGLSAAQIAEMRKCSIDDVFAAADAMGVARPPLRYASPGAQRGVHDQEPNESAARMFEANAQNKDRRGAARRPLPRPARPAPADSEPPVADDEDVFDPEEAFRPTDETELPGAEQETAVDGAASPALAQAAEGESLTLENEIIAYSQAGMDEHAIAQAVSSPGEKIGVRKVRAILKRYAEEPAAFG